MDIALAAIFFLILGLFAFTNLHISLVKGELLRELRAIRAAKGIK
jgi:hypothetical protein